MSTDALRQQIREKIREQVRQAGPSPGAASASAPSATPHATAAVVIPLRLGSAQDTAVLTQLFQRLAASQALLKMADAGLLRFDLRVDASGLACVAGTAPGAPAPTPTTQGASAMAATTAIDPAACCPSCKAGKACECKDEHCDLHAHPSVEAEAVLELKGVIGEKLVRTLAPGVKAVRLNPKAVMTPLGKDALRKRGITIDRGVAT